MPPGAGAPPPGLLPAPPAGVGNLGQESPLSPMSPTMIRAKEMLAEAQKQRTNQFFDVELEELSYEEIDVEATAKAMQIASMKRKAREKLLVGKSESFKEQFIKRNPTLSQDVNVTKSCIKKISDDIASLMRERKRVTVVFYGHEEVDRQGAARAMVHACLDSMRLTINRAGHMHEMKIENEKKLLDRARQASILEARNSMLMQATAMSPGSATPRQIEAAPTRRSLVGKPTGVKTSSGSAVQLSRDRKASQMSRQSQGTVSPRKPAPTATSPPLRHRKSISHISSQVRKSVVLISPPDKPRSNSNGNRVLPPLNTEDIGHGDDARMLRKSSVRSVGTLPTPSHGLKHISGNGRKGGINCLQFDGHTTHVKLQKIKGLEEWVSRAEIEFWMKCTDSAPMVILWVADTSTGVATLRISLNMNAAGDSQPDVIGVYLRDQNSNTFAAFANTVVLDGQWHHVRINLKNLQENVIDVHVDGRARQAYVTIAESPTKFSDWEQVGLIGAQYRGTAFESGMQAEMEYKGLLMDLKLTCHEEKSNLRNLWPLIDTTFEDLPTKIVDSVGGCTGDINYPNWVFEEFPQTYLWFNGTHTHINCGTLGNFGAEMACCSIEFWMKCDVKTRRMAVFKVTDSTAKQAQVGFELNTDKDGAYQRGSLLVTLRDPAGTKLIATQESHDLCDGQWHDIALTINALNNLLELRVDGYTMEMEYHAMEKPEQFLAFTQWFCLGAHNCRGKLQDFFEGSLLNFRLCTRAGAIPGEPTGMGKTALWPLNEGTGCTVAMDKTGNGNNGIIYDNKSKKKSSTWLPLNDPEGYAADDTFDQLEQLYNEKAFEKNNVDIGYVTIACTKDDVGTFREHLQDNLRDQQEVDMESQDMFRGLEFVPDSCYRTVAKHTDAEAIAQAHLDKPLAKHESSLFTMKIGDGQLNIFQLRGFCHREKAVWSAEMDEWVDPIMLMSQDDKLKNYVNKRSIATEKSLRQFGRSPLLVRKSTQGTNAVDTIFSEDSLASRMLKTSLTGEDDSYLVFLYLRRPDDLRSEQETASGSWFIKEQWQATRYHAAVTVQKRVRIFLAQKLLRLKRQILNEIVRQREYKKRLREEQPKLVAFRTQRYALIINATDATDKRVPVHESAQTRCAEMAEFLRTHGWEVTLLEDGTATAAAIQREVANLKRIAEEKKALVFMHVAAYGTKKGKYFAFPSRKSLKGLLEDQEAPARLRHYSQERLELSQIQSMFDAELAEVEAATQETAEEKKKREIEEARERRKSAAAAREKDKARWSTSTRVVKPGGEDGDGPNSPDSEKARAARRQSHAAASTPLPFEPSPTPELDIGPEIVKDVSDHAFFLAADTPIEYCATNTLPLDLLESVVRNEVGYHAVATGEIYAPPNVEGSTPWAYMAASNKQRCVWKSKAETFGRLLVTSLRGAATSDLRKMLKPQDLVEADARLQKELETADYEDQFNIKKQISSTIGTSWNDMYEFMGVEMDRVKAEVEEHQGVIEYVGDLVMVNMHMPGLITEYKRSAAEMWSILVRVAVTDVGQFTKNDLEEKTRNTVLNSLHTTFEGAVKPRRLPRSNPLLCLKFPHDVSKTIAPYANPEDWERYFDKLTDNRRKSVTWQMTVPSGEAGTFEVYVEVIDSDPKVQDAIMENICMLFRARVAEDCGLTSAALPAVPAMMPEIQRCFTYAAHTQRQMIQKIQETDNAIAQVEERIDQPVKLLGFHVASAEEHKLVNKLHSEELSRQRAEAEDRRANPTGDEARRAEIERKRKSLRQQR